MPSPVLFCICSVMAKPSRKPEECSSVGRMIAAGLRCTAFCGSCCRSREVALTAIAAAKGADFCLWNRRTRCRITDGCTGRPGFYFDDEEGRATPMWDF